MTDTASIEFELISVEPCRREPVRAVAAVRLAIEGIELTIAGFTLEARGTAVSVIGPRHRDPISGAWCPSLDLPDELMAAIAHAIGGRLGFDMVGGRALGEEDGGRPSCRRARR